MGKEIRLLRKIYFRLWRVPFFKDIAYVIQKTYSNLIRLKIKILGLNDLKTLYDAEFYNFSKEEVSKFVSSFVDIIIKEFNPKSVADIGCGIGLYVNEFDKRGVEAVGYDGSPYAIKNSVTRKGLLKIGDIRKNLNFDKKYDIVLSIEVAEHIPTKCSDIFVNTLTKCSDVIILTAAQKGQGGTDHINEQPRYFWIKKFEKKNFNFNKSLSEKLSFKMKEKGVPWWIHGNLMIFQK